MITIIRQWCIGLMDVAIRASLVLGIAFQGLLALQMISYSSLKASCFMVVIYGKFRAERNSNHYLSDIVGLVYLGLVFSEFKEAKKWREFGIKELVKEMKKQVYPDGVDYEGSVSYHRLVTELFLSATLLCLKNGITFPGWYMERLEKMIEFVMYYTKPNGSSPQIGDNDDGRLHILSNYGSWNSLDHRYLLAIGAVLFDRSDFASSLIRRLSGCWAKKG